MVILARRRPHISEQDRPDLICVGLDRCWSCWSTAPTSATRMARLLPLSATTPSRHWSRPRSCPGWGSRVLWSRSRRSPHCSGERRARAGREDQGWRLADRRFRTVDQPVKDVWDFLTSTEGTGLWLGQRGSRSYVATARMRVDLRAPSKGIAFEQVGRTEGAGIGLGFAAVAHPAVVRLSGQTGARSCRGRRLRATDAAATSGLRASPLTPRSIGRRACFQASIGSRHCR
jgi:hypothetical protein